MVFENLRSGLTTDNMLESDPPALRVSWIAFVRERIKRQMEARSGPSRI